MDFESLNLEKLIGVYSVEQFCTKLADTLAEVEHIDAIEGYSVANNQLRNVKSTFANRVICVGPTDKTDEYLGFSMKDSADHYKLVHAVPMRGCPTQVVKEIVPFFKDMDLLETINQAT